jgi:histidyl-tRNA synthetase
MANTQPVRGTKDLFGEDFARHHAVIEAARKITSRYGFSQMSTPIFEFTEIFSRGMGETSDVVSKEMYTFKDKGGESLTLRPEGTAGVVRAYLSNGLKQHLPVKVFYAGPMFRYERPQKGRYRQFHQAGIELLGVAKPQADVEVLAAGMDFLEELGLKENVVLEINSLGDTESRNAYKEKLVSYLEGFKDKLSDDSLERLYKNPLRILDSKEECDKEIVENAPILTDSLNEESTAYFNEVKQGLDALKIPYKVNPKLVRGLDYYCHTAFEFVTTELGSQGTVLAGGRYDGLVEMMGGSPTPGVGWACGIERLSMMVKNVPAKTRPIAVVPVGGDVQIKAMEIAHNIRQAGFSVDQSYAGNMGKRMKKANKYDCCAAVIIGSNELEAGKVTIKDFDSGDQKEIEFDSLIEELGIYK